MKQNIGKTDKYIRIGLGILIVAAGIYFKSWWGAVAVVPFVTAFTGLCPLYRILGLNTV
jgi:Inner membrane protein YgaP-like, transmembrane domain